MNRARTHDSMRSRYSLEASCTLARDYVSSHHQRGDFSVGVSIARIELVGFRVKGDLHRDLHNYRAVVQPRFRLSTRLRPRQRRRRAHSRRRGVFQPASISGSVYRMSRIRAGAIGRPLNRPRQPCRRRSRRPARSGACTGSRLRVCPPASMPQFKPTYQLNLTQLHSESGSLLERRPAASHHSPTCHRAPSATGHGPSLPSHCTRSRVLPKDPRRPLCCHRVLPSQHSGRKSGVHCIALHCIPSRPPL
jgi:hypothetical protein